MGLYNAFSIELMKLYKSGALKVQPKAYITSGVVAGGTVVFYLTSDSTNSGDVVFNNVYKESLNWWIDDTGAQYQVGGYTLSADKKTLTLTINKLGSVLLGIIQLTSAANGVTVNLTVWGD